MVTARRGISMRTIDKRLPFSPAMQKAIEAGKKICTSRGQRYNDPRVYLIIEVPLWIVRNYFWKMEGCDSPEHFEKVWRGVNRGRYDKDKIVAVHFGIFSKMCDSVLLAPHHLLSGG